MTPRNFRPWLRLEDSSNVVSEASGSDLYFSKEQVFEVSMKGNILREGEIKQIRECCLGGSLDVKDIFGRRISSLEMELYFLKRFYVLYWGNHEDRKISVKKFNEDCKIPVKKFDEDEDEDEGLNHKNILTILGCCLETELPILVYEYSSKENLYKLLYDVTVGKDTLSLEYRLSALSWESKLRIATEIADAILTETEPPEFERLHALDYTDDEGSSSVGELDNAGAVPVLSSETLDQNEGDSTPSEFSRSFSLARANDVSSKKHLLEVSLKKKQIGRKRNQTTDGMHNTGIRMY
ncbi:hypothetical protein GIB67_032493 [Kingdonia uniflora]|uniref:Serine-threonine/tyrosine-protein kinase catalytic domain-containing protein n=1 Tax=Kingdonia uniflora TaxID=39325 RepID=A0A7J7L7R3_9MAGN|nr:hypothetical protein GIB67_032493 [Kingdonia uniflora]